MPQYLVAVVVLFAAAFMPSPSFGKPAVNRHTSTDDSRDEQMEHNEQNCNLFLALKQWQVSRKKSPIAHQIILVTWWGPEK